MADKRTGYLAGDDAGNGSNFEDLHFGNEPMDLESELLGRLNARSGEEAIPTIPLSKPSQLRPAYRQADSDMSIEADASALEDEFNALLGNLGARETAEYQPAPQPAAAVVARAEHRAAAAPSAPTVASPERDDPFAMLAAMAERYNDDAIHVKEEARHRVDPVFGAAEAPVARSTRFVPEFETVDIVERAMPLEDDLDIPELQFSEEPAPQTRYADTEMDIEGLLNEINGVVGQKRYVPQEAAVVSHPYVDTSRNAPHFAETTEVAHSNQRTNQPADFDDLDAVFEMAIASGPQHAQQLEDGYGDELDLGNYDEPLPPKRRRGALMAAIAGGVAVLGITVAAATSFIGSGASSLPALVKSDNSPIKVRPAVANGPTVPNANSTTVYETVANGTQAEKPDQDKLMTGAEVPIELADELPTNEDEDVAAKAEDRLEQVAEAPAESGSMAVPPRKVRTMIVNSDGTLVAAETKQSASANAVAPKTPKAKPVATSEDTASGAGVEDQTTASIEPQAAVTGAWSIQIASEGSEKGARAAAKRLMSKHGKVIGGMPVSIIKADLGGKGVVWRVRLSADSRNEAASLCSKYKSAGGSCFVSKS